MDSAARHIDDTTILETGQVHGTGDGTFRVATSSGTVRARRAVSCLVAPEEGDLVQLSSRGDGRSWILAVLERESPVTTLSAPGDLRIEVDAGTFCVAARDGVSIATADEVSVASARVDVNTVEARLAAQTATLLGRFLQTEFEKVRSFAGTVDAVFDRLSQKVKRSYRTVENDQVRAKRIDYAAEKNVSLRGHNALVTAEQLVKIDGEQIHLG